MRIRRIKKRDFNSAFKLFFRVWPTKNASEIERVKKFLIKAIKNKEGFVAEEKGKIVGIIEFSKGYFKDSDYLDFVIIDKEYRKKGLAIDLIKAFEKDAKNRKVRRIFSCTIPKNMAALKLHKKLGYQYVGYIYHIWKEGDKEIFFSKKIK